MNVAANIAGTRHITESCYQLFLVHLQQMEEGLGPGVVAVLSKLLLSFFFLQLSTLESMREEPVFILL